jgi:hypothetical protein
MNTKYFQLSLAFFLMLTITLSSCSKKVYGSVIPGNPEYNKMFEDKIFSKANSELDTIIGVEKTSPGPGKLILETGRKMALKDKTIIKGSCWNWVNEVFNRSGFGTNKKIVYNSKKSGPYADISQIKPGDWLYYINYSYNKIEHSGIFVYWKDYKKKLGVILSYSGRNRSEPARYLTYDLRSVYYITRAGEK